MILNFRKYIKERKMLAIDRAKRIQPNSLLFSFDENKTIFIHIPKTAGLSVVKSIFGVSGGHRSSVYYKKLFGKDFDKYFKFSFVRNPWDRLYSAYCFLELGGVNKHDKIAFKKYLGNCLSFEDFVMNWLDEKIIFKIIHFFPQSYFLVDDSGTLLVDFIGRFENLHEDYKFISKKIGITHPLFHINKVKNKDLYKTVYTKQMIDKVNYIYQEDIKRFEYFFN